MKRMAAVFAELQSGFVVPEPHLATPVRGKPILLRTLERILNIPELERLILAVTPADADAARGFLTDNGLDARVEVLATMEPRVRKALLRAGRIWNLDAWRGGVLGATWFDEYLDPINAARVIDHLKCEGLLCCSGYQPAFDTALAARQFEYLATHVHETDLVFTQAPPGLAGILVTPDAVKEWLEQTTPVGIEFAYRPEIPRPDPTGRAPCLQIEREIVRTPGRWTGDTSRSRQLLEAAWAALGEDADSHALVGWQRTNGSALHDPLPAEVELELTTADGLPETRLRPRGGRVPHRALGESADVERLATELGSADDRRVVLGGFGDPLLHPQFAEICAALRAGGVLGLGVVTHLVDAPQAALDALLDTPVDLVQVQIDAHSAATYARVHGRDAFEAVVATVRTLLERRRAAGRARPLIVPSLTRHADTLPELEAFYDAWIPAAGWAVLEGYSDHAGALPADSLLPLTPPTRERCRRIDRRLFLRADGKAAACGEALHDEVLVGDWRSETLADIWRGTALEQLRRAHAAGQLSQLTACQNCQQWFRP